MASSLKSPVERLKGLGRRLRGDPEGAAFELGGHEFTGLRLLEKLPGRMWSRAGRLSWAARMDGRPVKVVECASEAHAAFLERIGENPELGAYFPTVHFRLGSLAVVDWVEGQELDWPRVWREPGLLDQLTTLQVRLHATELDLGTASTGYDYRDFLLERARRFKSILPLDDALEEITRSIADPAGPTQPRLSHADVSAANLVSERGSGRLLAIDNELITQSPYYSIDLLNTARSFHGERKPKELRRYLATYVQQGGSLEPLAKHSEFFAALWYLRLIGTLLQSGDLAGAARIAGDFSGRKAPTDPILSMAQEIASS